MPVALSPKGLAVFVVLDGFDVASVGVKRLPTEGR